MDSVVEVDVSRYAATRRLGLSTRARFTLNLKTGTDAAATGSSSASMVLSSTSSAAIYWSRSRPAASRRCDANSTCSHGGIGYA